MLFTDPFDRHALAFITPLHIALSQRLHDPRQTLDSVTLGRKSDKRPAYHRRRRDNQGRRQCARHLAYLPTLR